jgi:hypothetical protein
MLRLLLPALVPSWRFFDRIGASPRIEYALSSVADAADSQWTEVRPNPARVSAPAMVGRLFWNPRRNETLYLVSCAERLIESPSPARGLRLWTHVADLLRVDGRATPDARFLRVRVIEARREDGQLVEWLRFVSEARPMTERAATWPR